MTSENIYNKDGTRRSCPHGAALSFPIGTVRHVKVGDMNCKNCPCYKERSVITITCCYPNFSPKYGIDDNKT